MMRYLSLFSGIEACTVAWKPLGWTCVGVAEIEPFPAAVLAHHYPGVPNLGDVTKITDEQIAALGPLDLVVGGSPCQDLSVAGKRKGLAGERSGLFHEQVRIFHAARALCGARFLLWENVPGAFSSHGGRDFGIVVGTMAGAELGVPSGGWGTCGAAIGENGLLEWRVLDAQYVRVESHPRAVPQRRRRVFALLDTGAWRDRPPILLEPEGLRGHPAPRREAGQGSAGGSGCGFEVGGALEPRVSRLTTDECAQGAAIVAHSLKAEGFDASEDGAGRGVPLVCGALSDGAHMGGGSTARTPTPAGSSPLPEVAWALQERDAKGSDSSTKPGHLIPVGGGFDDPIPFDTTQITSAANYSRPQPGDPAHPLAAGAHAIAIAMAVRTANTGANVHGVADEVAHTIDQAQGQAIAAIGFDEVADPVAANQARTYTREGANNFRVSNVAISAMQVRRLTPRECERLQGFPDDYTLVPVRGKPAADGPRYRALGNSMAVNCMRWIGERISAAVRGELEDAA